MADPSYLIMAGVRRAVAAREQGLTTIRAEVTSGPDKGSILDIPLEHLLSPKDRISRTDQGGRYLKVESAMADPAIRQVVPPIEIVPMKSHRVRFYTPLRDVVLEP